MATVTLPLTKTTPAVLYPRAQWYFLLAMAITWLGFSHSYFAVLPSQPLLHHIHGALMGGWIALLAVQPVLYQRGRIQLHRTLGRWGVYLLVPAMVGCGFLMIRSMLNGTELPLFIVDQLTFLDVTSLVLFPAFVALSVWYGRTLALHARYIVCTVLLLMPPAVTRALFIIPGMHSFQRNVNVSLALVDAVLLLLIADDVRRGKIRAAYPVALLTFSATFLASNFAHGWTWWHALTAWLAGHPNA
ncbi:MAG: hypothetical protein ACRYGF_11410 [Janthinobacterium lividum]